jgi:hypothetical protein
MNLKTEFKHVLGYLSEAQVRSSDEKKNQGLKISCFNSFSTEQTTKGTLCICSVKI